MIIILAKPKVYQANNCPPIKIWQNQQTKFFINFCFLMI